MKKVYFIFKDMKEATYYFRNITCELSEVGEHIEIFPSQKRLIILRTKEEKGNLLTRIFAKFRKKERIFVENNLEIIFKSTKFKSINAEQNDIYTFLKNDYETNYFIKLIDKI